MYAANRFIIWSLRAEDLSLFEGGALTLDVRTKTFIHEHLDYAYALVDTSADVECELLLTEGRAPVGEKIAHERPSLGFALLLAIICTCEQDALKKSASRCNKKTFLIRPSECKGRSERDARHLETDLRCQTSLRRAVALAKPL